MGLPYSSRPEVAGRIGLGTLLRMHPVDDNPHDPDAVEVWHDGEVSVRVGFVARQETLALRSLPQATSAWRLRVVGRSEQALCATLELTRADNVSAGGEDASEYETPSDQDDLFSREQGSR